MENPNVRRFTGFADIYDQYRPKPPEMIADLLLQLAGADRADHVVDLGCGTGLSTLIWINPDEFIYRNRTFSRHAGRGQPTT